MEPSTPSHSSATKASRKQSRLLWAAPVFVVGVVVLTWVGVTRPFLNRPEQQPARDLQAARQQLDRPDGDAEAATALVLRALEHPEFLPGRTGEAYFLLGRAEARQAGQSPPRQAATLWADAWNHLTEADKQGVGEDDRQKLIYQLGKVGYFTKDDPRRVLDRLARSAGDADDRAEGYDLLTRSILRLPDPDLEAALRANELLRQVAVGDQLAAAKLLGGELYLKLQRPDKAREVLERINPPAPAPLVFKARVLRARTFQDEGRWGDAAALWQSVVGDKQAPAAGQALLLYNLGLCYRRLERPGEAAKIWEQCLAQPGDGDEGPACALSLAELALEDGQTAKALGLFARAVEKTPLPSSWTNALVERASAVASFERASQLLLQNGQFEPALQLTGSYERLAAPGKAHVLRGDVWTEWARQGERQLREPDPASSIVVTPATVSDHFRQAAAAYLQAAEQVAEAGDKANYLWLGTQRYLSGMERPQAAAVFAQLQKVDPRSPHLGEGWYLLGESYRGAKDVEAAEAAYKESIKYPTPFAYRARFQLAQFALERGDIDDAEAALEQNLKLLRFDRDDEAQEKSLFAIGKLCFFRHKYALAAGRLEEALERYPDNADTVRARLNLAQAYQQMADQQKFNVLLKTYKNPDTIDHFVNENRRQLRRAAEEFEHLLAPQDKAKVEAQLTPDEIVKIAFNAAECRFLAGQYELALARFEMLVEQFAQKQRTEAEQDYYRMALGDTVRCMLPLIGPMNDYQKRIRNRLAEISPLLEDLSDEARVYWEDWLDRAKKGLGKP